MFSPPASLIAICKKILIVGKERKKESNFTRLEDAGKRKRKRAVINMSRAVGGTGGAGRCSELMFAPCETVCKDLC